MKFRTRLYISLIFLTFICLAIALSFTYLQLRNLFLYEFRSKAISIAATTASLLDAEVLKKINGPQDANTPDYINFREKLRKVRENNHRDDVYVVYVYTLKPAKDNPHDLVMAISAANTPEETVPIGTSYKVTASEDLPDYLLQNYSPKEFVKDPWGIWLRAYAPIYDAQGQYAATLGIDISAKNIEHQLFYLLKISLFSLALTFLVAIVNAFFLTRSLTHSLTVIRTSIKKISKGDFSAKPILQTHDEFQELADKISLMTEGLKERDRLKSNFAKYVSTHVLEKTLAIEAPNKIEGERKKITVVFVGIHNFLQLTEILSPEEVVQILNQYFSKMIDIIFVHKGTLDKFISGGMMIEFGAPKDDPHQEEHAVNAVLQMRKDLQKLANEWKKERKPQIEIGIGIHTGLAVVGTIGSEKRMEYTAIGDTVNVAARLQSLSNDIGHTIVISEPTYQAVKNTFAFTNLGLHKIAGRKEEINLYTL